MISKGLFCAYVHVCVCVCVLLAFTFSVYVFFAKTEYFKRNHRKSAPLLHIWQSDWPRYRVLLQARRGSGGLCHQTMILFFKH